MTPRPFVCVLVLTALAVSALPAWAAPIRVDDSDPEALEASATAAFYSYLQAIDNEELEEAYKQVLDPGDREIRLGVFDQLIGFMRGRQKNPVRNEAVVVRCSGDWAMVVYQYDTTIGGKTARVITTAWMLQWEGFWRQFIAAPKDESFWEARLSDYERLQKWFDDYAKELSEAM